MSVIVRIKSPDNSFTDCHLCVICISPVRSADLVLPSCICVWPGPWWPFTFTWKEKEWQQNPWHFHPAYKRPQIRRLIFLNRTTFFPKMEQGIFSYWGQETARRVSWPNSLSGIAFRFFPNYCDVRNGKSKRSLYTVLEAVLSPCLFLPEKLQWTDHGSIHAFTFRLNALNTWLAFAAWASHSRLN